MKQQARRTPGHPASASSRYQADRKRGMPPATEVIEWLDRVLADPEFASAVEERLIDMRAEQKREAARARGLPRHAPAHRGEARGRRQTSSEPGCRTSFVVRTPYTGPSDTARRLGRKAEEVSRLDQPVESSCERVAPKMRRAKSAPKRRPG